jgi:hypothetical protein
MSFDAFVQELGIDGLADTLKEQRVKSIYDMKFMFDNARMDSFMTVLNVKAGEWIAIGKALAELSRDSKFDQKSSFITK